MTEWLSTFTNEKRINAMIWCAKQYPDGEYESGLYIYFGDKPIAAASEESDLVIEGDFTENDWDENGPVGEDKRLHLSSQDLLDIHVIWTDWQDETINLSKHPRWKEQ